MKKLLFAIAFTLTMAVLTPAALAQGGPASKPSVAAAATTRAPASMPSVTSAPAGQADSPGASAVMIAAVVVVVVAVATLVFLRWRRA